MALVCCIRKCSVVILPGDDVSIYTCEIITDWSTISINCQRKMMMTMATMTIMFLLLNYHIYYLHLACNSSNINNNNKKKISCCWGASRMTLSGRAMLHTDNGYSRHVNLYGIRLFTVSFEFIHQMAPMSVVQEMRSLTDGG